MLLRFALVAGLSVVALAACSKRTLPPGGAKRDASGAPLDSPIGSVGTPIG